MATLPSSICLTSTASLAVFPFNSRTKFTNVLPAPIHKENPEKSLYVRLRAIGISTLCDEVMGTDPHAGYLRVNLHELSEQHFNQGTDQAAGGFEYPPKTNLKANTSFAYHVFSRTPYLKLKLDVIHKFQVSLTNAIGRPVHGIYGGPPTIVLLDINNDMDVDNFTMTCSSSHPLVYTSNTLTEFTSPLYQQMDLSSYQVALVNVMYPPSLTETTIATMSLDGERFTYVLNDFENTTAFIHKVGLDVRGSRHGHALKFEVQRRGRYRGKVALTRSVDPARNVGVPEVIRCSFSRTFTMACGQEHDFKSVNLLTVGKMVVFEGSRANIHLAKPNPISLLHCDIVKNGIVGEKYAKMLACVPVLTEEAAGQNRLHEVGQLIYYDTVSQPVNAIKFKFTNPDGSPRSFTSAGDAERFDNILVTLSFRMKRASWYKKMLQQQQQQQE